MTASATTQSVRYNRVAMIVHWVMAATILSLIVVGVYMHNLSNDQAALKFELYQWHKSFGVVMLFLGLFRLGWRFSHRPPKLPAAMPSWERFAANATHWAFYGLMIATPIAGWAVASASPYEIPTVLFGLIPWPHLPFVEASEASESFFSEVHELLAFMIVGLFLLHVGAALRHHFVLKDDILTRMAPWLRVRGR